MSTSFKSTLVSAQQIGGHNMDYRIARPNPNAKGEVETPISPPSSTKAASVAGSELDAHVPATCLADAKICYEGDYKFAPIKESQVSRAMTKRYGEDLYRTAVSYEFPNI